MRKARHWKVQNNMNKVEKKRQKEQYIVEEMIRLYCRKNHLEEERQGRQMCEGFIFILLYKQVRILFRRLLLLSADAPS